MTIDYSQTPGGDPLWNGGPEGGVREAAARYQDSNRPDSFHHALGIQTTHPVRTVDATFTPEVGAILTHVLDAKAHDYSFVLHGRTPDQLTQRDPSKCKDWDPDLINFDNPVGMIAGVKTKADNKLDADKLRKILDEVVLFPPSTTSDSLAPTAHGLGLDPRGIGLS